jgi:hypothetical protein
MQDMQRKNKIIIIVIAFLISSAILEYSNIINIFPVPAYQKKTELINPNVVCENIKDEQMKKICFDVVKANDFEKGLTLIDKDEKYPAGYYPWYDFPFYSSPRYDYFPGGITKMLAEGKNYNSEQWCKETYLLHDPLKEDYYFCRAFLENPNFCNEISYFITGPSSGICYEDAAFVWKDPALCQKAKHQDLCYMRIVLNYLENKK